MSRRLPLLALAMGALMAGMLSGLWRAGWHTPVPHDALFNLHGAIMVCAFLGGLIGLERAVGVGRRWAFFAPVAAVLAGLTMFFDRTAAAAPWLAAASSATLVGILLSLRSRLPREPAVLMSVGALAWFTGCVAWGLGATLPSVVPMWIAFLALTLAGERRELTRVRPWPQLARRLFAAGAAAIGLGAALALPLSLRPAGVRIAGAGMILLGGVLFRYDLARLNLPRGGRERFMAISLLGGYLWLVIAGVMTLLWGQWTAGFRYDAVLHSFFLGFVFSMIFAHAPLIFPALMNLQMSFHPIFYLHLTLLHASLILRLIGDYRFSPGLRIAGSLLNAVAIVVFLLNSATSLRRGPATDKSATPA